MISICQMTMKNTKTQTITKPKISIKFSYFRAISFFYFLDILVMRLIIYVMVQYISDLHAGNKSGKTKETAYF